MQRHGPAWARHRRLRRRWGLDLVVTNLDGQLDIAVANGHILDNAPHFRAGSTYMQRRLLFHNTNGRRFNEIGRRMGAAKVGRGLAAGDIDNDGDLDLLINNNGQTADC